MARSCTSRTASGKSPCRRRIAQEQDGFAAEIALTAARLLLTDPPKDLPKHLENLRMINNDKLKQLRALDAEMQMRPALSFGCLCFVLVGCPVGIWFSRSDYLSGFITCFLPIVFIYYPLMLCGTGMAKEGKFNIVPLVWGADAVIGLMGVVLFWR